MGRRIPHIRVLCTKVSCTISMLGLQWETLQWGHLTYRNCKVKNSSCLWLAEEELWWMQWMWSEGKRSSRELIKNRHEMKIWIMEKINLIRKKGRQIGCETLWPLQVKKNAEFAAGQTLHPSLKQSSQRFSRILYIAGRCKTRREVIGRSRNKTLEFLCNPS